MSNGGEDGAMIRLQHVTKLYGSVIGVNDVTLSLANGAYGLLGPNGSGKSTLLNLITGQLRPTLGTVHALDRKPWGNSELFRRIGVCPEQEMMCPDVSGLDWVRYMLRLHGFNSTDASQRAEDALDRLGMADAMRRPMGSYSRGMRQRAKLAQAIAHDPELLVLDEPFSGLDPIARHQMTEFLKEWIAAGRGLLLASHILHEVEAITQSFLLICGGRLLASGSAEEVHALLADVPNEIRIRCNDAAKLAQRLMATGAVESVRLTDGGQGLVLATASPAIIYNRLPEWIADADVRIDELRSTDDSLQALFDSLLRIHRGRS